MTESSRNTSNLTSEIFKSRETILSVLQGLEYDTEAFQFKSFAEIDKMQMTDQLNMLIEHKKDAKRVFLAFHLKANLRDLDPFVDEYFGSHSEKAALNNDDWLILIVNEKKNENMIESMHMKLRQVYEKNHIFITVMTLPRLQYNILHHELYSPHIILSDQEKQEVMKTYYVENDEDFPSISRFDAVANLVGLRPGQMVRIVRPSLTAITNLSIMFASHDYIDPGAFHNEISSLEASMQSAIETATAGEQFQEGVEMEEKYMQSLNDTALSLNTKLNGERTLLKEYLHGLSHEIERFKEKIDFNKRENKKLYKEDDITSKMFEDYREMYIIEIFYMSMLIIAILVMLWNMKPF